MLDGILLGRGVDGGNVGDVVGCTDGKFVGPAVLGKLVGVDVT